MTTNTLEPSIARPPRPDSEYRYRRSLRKRLALAVRHMHSIWQDNVTRRGVAPKTHIVICGFPRSGTTLLQLIVESCVDDVYIFGTECRALTVARCVRTDLPFLMSKWPMDVFWVDEIREAYANRDTEVKFVLSLRDPRDVLTSSHVNRPEKPYFLDVDRWSPVYEHFKYARQFPDTHVVRYEELVSSPEKVEAQLREFAGWEWRRPIENFHEAIPGKFNMRPLNGLRPIDKKGAGRWQDPKHAERIRQILREIPEMPQYLIDEGYEPDKSWAADYGVVE